MRSRTEIPKVCPYCNQPLVNESAVAHLLRKERELENRQQRLGRDLRAQLEAQARVKIQQEVARRVAAVKAGETKKSERLAQVADELKQQLVDLRSERGELQRRHKADLTTLKREHEAELRKELAEARRRLKETLRPTIAREEQTKARRGYEGQMRTLNRVVSSLEGENERLKRQMERLSPADRGDWNEEAVLQRLQVAFRHDDIERHKKGRRGSDILHSVRCRVGNDMHDAGLIVYECKDTARWDNDFIPQMKRAGRTHGTSYLVLVSKAFPRSKRDLFVQDGVVVVHPNHVLHVAHMIRTMVVGIFQADLSAEGRMQKTQELFRYLTSERFRQAFGSISDSVRSLKEQLEDERESHRRTWGKRERAYNEIKEATDTIDADIRGVIERPVASRRSKVVPLTTSSA